MSGYAIALCVLLALAVAGAFIGNIRAKVLYDFGADRFEIGLVESGIEYHVRSYRWSVFAYLCMLAAACIFTLFFFIPL